MADNTPVLKDVLIHGLQHLENCREEVDLLMNCSRDPDSTNAEMSEIAVTILQNLRTVQYSIEEAIMISELGDESTPDVDKAAN